MTREGFDARKAGAAVVQEHAQESARKSEIRSLIETLGGAKVQRFEAEVVRVALTTVVPPVVGAPAAAQVRLFLGKALARVPLVMSAGLGPDVPRSLLSGRAKRAHSFVSSRIATHQPRAQARGRH